MSNNWIRDLRRIKMQVCSPELEAADGASIYVVASGIPDEMILKRIRIIGDIETNDDNVLSIKILNNAAMYREKVSDNKNAESHVVYSWSDQYSVSNDGEKWVFDVVFSDDVIYSDELKSNNIYFYIESIEALTEATNFDITVWGEGLPRLNVPSSVYHSYPSTTHPAFYRYSDGNVWNNLNVFNTTDSEKFSIPLFNSDDDYIYIGTEVEWDGLWFNLSSPNITESVVNTWEYWSSDNNGEWKTLTIRDNCTDDASDPTPFAYSGVIEWDHPSDWVKTDLSYLNFPYERSISAKNYGSFPVAHENHSRIPRYWVRFNLDDITTQPEFKWIRKKPYIEE